MPANILVYDINKEVASNLKTLFPEVHVVSGLEDVTSADYVFIALHPPVLKEMLPNIEPNVQASAIVVSLAPKITLEKLDQVLPTKKLVRVIPNATSVINKGYNPLAFAPACTEDDKKQVFDLLNPMGDAIEIPENDLEGYAIISAMLPTYFWFQWKQILDLSHEMGLETQEANRSVRDTLHAAVDLMFDSGFDYKTMEDLIPVKPMNEHEKSIRSMFYDTLMKLHNKISPGS